MPEYTPQQLDEYRLNQIIEASIARSKQAYADREWLQSEPEPKKKPKFKPKKPIYYKPYKARKSTTKLETSKYYAASKDN